MKFLLLEDEWQIRDATFHTLRSLDSGAEVLEARSLKAALQILDSTTHVDLILLDLNVDDSRGIDTLKHLAAWIDERHLNTRIVVVSGVNDVDLVAEVIDNYGTGFIIKASSREIFACALAITIAGGVYLPDGPCRELISRNRPWSAAAHPMIPFTERESEVAAHLIKGKTYKRIALDLKKKQDGDTPTDNTVRAHVANIARKMGLSSPAKAGVIAEIARRQLIFRVP